jgi:hypothetical protein
MFKKCTLATAVGMICGGAAVSASAQGLDLNGPNDQALKYAHELLFAADPEGPIQILDDAGGDSDFIVSGLLDAGTSADDSLFIRFDMTNAQFRDTRFISAVEINNPDGSPALSSGGLANFGAPGDDKVIFSVQGQENIAPPDANPAQGALDVNDTVVFDLAAGGTGTGSGLTWIDRDQPVTVKMCVYETLDDARAETNDVMSNGCVEKTLIDPSEDALVFMCEKPGANPVADVWSDDGNYQNFIQQFEGTGRVNVGTCHIESRDDYLNVAGERATVGELLGPDYDLQVSDGDLSTWAADSNDGAGFVGLVEDDDCTDSANDFLVLDWLGGNRESNTLVRRMSDGLWDLDDTKVTFNVCLNDLPGAQAPEMAIPIVEQHIVTLVSDNEKDAVYRRSRGWHQPERHRAPLPVCHDLRRRGSSGLPDQPKRYGCGLQLHLYA